MWEFPIIHHVHQAEILNSVGVPHHTSCTSSSRRKELIEMKNTFQLESFLPAIRKVPITFRIPVKSCSTHEIFLRWFTQVLFSETCKKEALNIGQHLLKLPGYTVQRHISRSMYIVYTLPKKSFFVGIFYYSRFVITI